MPVTSADGALNTYLLTITRLFLLARFCKCFYQTYIMINSNENNTIGYNDTSTIAESSGELDSDNYETAAENNHKNEPKDESFKDVDTLNDAGENNFEDGQELTREDFKATGEVTGDDDDDLMIDEEEDDTDITEEEADALDNAGDGEDDDDTNLKDAQLDKADDEGDLLDENDDVSGDDLDVPGAELDDDDEIIGNEDEENNSYSSNKQED